jgi:membrane protease YdiL (CAAX protease family)
MDEARRRIRWNGNDIEPGALARIRGAVCGAPTDLSILAAADSGSAGALGGGGLLSLPAQLPQMLALFVLGAAVIGVSVRVLAPHLLFRFVRQHPRLWATLMVIYPVLSVYPQGIIYRGFLMHRYTALFGTGWGLIVASAAAFAFMHLIFRNRLAVALTFVGGLLFAWRYQVTGSLLTSSVEHAFYGCWLFTVGLGDYFYHGTAFGSTNLAAVKVLRGRAAEARAA